jgi:hypothetical protein
MHAFDIRSAFRPTYKKIKSDPAKCEPYGERQPLISSFGVLQQACPGWPSHASLSTTFTVEVVRKLPQLSGIVFLQGIAHSFSGRQSDSSQATQHWEEAVGSLRQMIGHNSGDSGKQSPSRFLGFWVSGLHLVACCLVDMLQGVQQQHQTPDQRALRGALLLVQQGCSRHKSYLPTIQAQCNLMIWSQSCILKITYA